MELEQARTTIDRLATVWASVSALCRPFTSAEWDTATDCPSWTVKDQVSHLIGTERMLGGRSTSAHKAPPAAHVRNPIGEMNEDHVDERRPRAGADVLAEFDEITAERLLQLRRYGAADFAVETMTPTGPGTVADFLHLRVMDCWVHEQDIRRAVGRPGHLDGPVAEHAVDRFLGAFPMIVGKRAKVPVGASVRLLLSGPVHRDGTVLVAERAAWATGDAAPSATATLTMDSEAYVVATTGRRPPAELLANGRIALGGDEAVAAAVVAALNIMI